MPLNDKRLAQGFTLIELVIVIIVLGVLSAVAIPKFVNRGGFEDYSVRDQLISRLRLVQLQSMNADPSESATENACYWLVVESDCFYHEDTARVAGTCLSPSASGVCSDDSYSDYAPVPFPSDMLITTNYRFDLDGKLLSSNASLPLNEEIVIPLNGDNNLSITIEDEGFIHD